MQHDAAAPGAQAAVHAAWRTGPRSTQAIRFLLTLRYAASGLHVVKNYIYLMLLLSIGFFCARFVLSKAIQQYFDGRMYLSLVVILAGGFLIHNTLLFMLLGGVVLLATATSRLDAICRSAVLTTLIPNVDQLVIVGGHTLTGVSMPVTLSVAAFIVCRLRASRQSYRDFTAEDGIVVLMIFIFGIAYGRLNTFSELERAIVTTVFNFGFSYYIYRRYVLDQAEFGHVIAALAGTAIILSVFAICEAKMHWSIYDGIYQSQSSIVRMSLNLKVRGGLLRAPASFSDSTAFAIFEVVGVFAVISSRKFFRSSMLWWGTIALTTLGTLAAQSRGADLGLMFGLFVLMVVRRRYGLAVAVAGGGAALVALLLVLATSNPVIANMLGAEKHVGTDQDYRQTLFRRGLEVGMEHPIFGNDMNVVLAEMGDIKQGEGFVDLVNSYLTIFLSSGFVGLTVFTGLVIAIFVRMFGAGGRVKDQAFDDLQMFAAGGLGAVLLALAFTPMAYERNGYWLLLLFACSRGLGMQARRSPTAEPRELRHAAMPAFGAVHRWQAQPILDLP